jgi:alpha-beta hydrolase superfamily lysophospholipase
VGGYRFALRPTVAWSRRDHIENYRWALSSIDPAAGRVLSGAFRASDDADVPYRLWLAKKPRGAILLLHGCCDYSGAFDDIAPKLVQRGFSCMAYDQRGFGATASRGQWTSRERYAQDVRDGVAFFRTRLDAGIPLFIVGESMGGSVAVHAAASQPHLDLSGIVLVAPGALASALRNRFYNWLMTLLGLIAGKSEIVVERNDASELAPSAAIRLLGDPMVMQAIRADLLAGVIAMGYSAVDAAKSVTVPSLTMLAGKDDLLRGACVRQLYENLGGEKDWLTLKNGPHLLLHWEHGGVVLRRARRWIERQMARRMAAAVEIPANSNAAKEDHFPASSVNLLTR